MKKIMVFNLRAQRRRLDKTRDPAHKNRFVSSKISINGQ